MKGLALGAALTVIVVASAAHAQTPPPQTPPPQTQKPTPPTPQTQKPVAPTIPAPAAAPAAPPAPFPEGAKVAFVVLQRIANESADGKAATAKIQALQQKKATELNDKQK